MVSDAQTGDEADLAAAVTGLGMVPFWEVRGDIEPTAPRPRVHPHIWKWKSIEPQLRRAATEIPLENAERRAMLCSNPGLSPKPYLTDTILAAYSLYNPGEQAPVHRHTPSASRFLLEGEGGFTTVEGEKCSMSRGDLILTPNGTWHDHGNEGDAPIVWIDVLDLPLVESLNVSVFEFDYSETSGLSNTGEPVDRQIQTIRHPDNHSTNLYGSGGMMPLFGRTARGRAESSPMFVYRGAETRARLDVLSGYPGDPHDGVIMEFVDPVTGGPVMQTLSYRAQLLRAGESTQTHRHASSTMYCVMEGSGTTRVDGKRLNWEKNDTFCVPGWSWHSHENETGADSVLYSVTDEPTLKKLGLYREESGKVSATA